MSPRYALLVVEGAHDQAFVGRVLVALGLTSFKEKPDQGREERLDPFWAGWKPEIAKNRRLYDPIFMPMLYRDDTRSVMVKVADGSGILKGFPSRLSQKPEWLNQLANSAGALGLIADADQKAVSNTFQDFATAYQTVLGGFPTTVGAVEATSLPSGETLRVGTFILPNNSDGGTVESVLLPVGEMNHGPILVHAGRFVDGCEGSLKAHFKPFDHLKAKVAAVASILQPGSTNTVTIEKDDWITPSQLDHPALAPFVTFLRDLLELPPETG